MALTGFVSSSLAAQPQSGVDQHSEVPFLSLVAGFVPLCSVGSDGIVGVGRSTERETLLLVAVAVLSMEDGRGGRSMQQLLLPSFFFLARFDCPAAATSTYTRKGSGFAACL